MKMQNVQKGFTLIELVVVVVLLGILGVTALAKFQDLSAGAQTSANAGVAAELSSGASINYAATQLGATNTPIGAQDCATYAGSLLASGVPAGYTFGGGANDGDCSAVSAGVSVLCSVDGGGTGTAQNASVICN